ncbi:MAG TPA: hypothetical protein VMW70_11450 [Burkholderiales bacterium]|nr:hypothetical protein [Burkholderiales bacterium]
MVPQAKQEVQGEAKLLFAGMIRAINNLLLSCHKDSDFVNRIKHAVQACSVEDSIAEKDSAEKDNAEKKIWCRSRPRSVIASHGFRVRPELAETWVRVSHFVGNRRAALNMRAG